MTNFNSFHRDGKDQEVRGALNEISVVNSLPTSCVTIMQWEDAGIKARSILVNSQTGWTWTCKTPYKMFTVDWFSLMPTVFNVRVWFRFTHPNLWQFGNDSEKKHCFLLQNQSPKYCRWWNKKAYMGNQIWNRWQEALDEELYMHRRPHQRKSFWYKHWVHSGDGEEQE